MTTATARHLKPMHMHMNMHTHLPKPTIAYAVSVTSCKKKQLVMDGASVLQHSIHLNSVRTPSSGSTYDYEMIAFVHPDAVDCIEILSTLNYTVHIKTVPFAINHIRGEYRKWANRTGCCGEKEWLKLYAYTLVQFPVVAHLDLDCLLLKPLDDLFDVMIYKTGRDKIPAMWLKPNDMPETIDAFFTRDYGMIGRPGHRQPHQIGVQGGFLVVRPNHSVFEEYIDIILDGNYTEAQGWGGAVLKYGGYYGAGTIQGLAAMYYSHLYPERAVELNRCFYNNMADYPYPKKYQKPEFANVTNKPCITLQATCQDCRDTDIDDIRTIHQTNCFKPWDCPPKQGVPPICIQHRYEWFRVRHLLEAKWRGEVVNATRRKDVHGLSIQELSFGFCSKHGTSGYRGIDKDLATITAGLK